AAAHRSRPNGSIRILVNGIDAVLYEAIPLGVGFGCKQSAGEAQVGESALLPAEPQFISASRDGIDNVLAKQVIGHGSGGFTLQPAQAAIDGRIPDPIVRVDVDRSAAF